MRDGVAGAVPSANCEPIASAGRRTHHPLVGFSATRDRNVHYRDDGPRVGLMAGLAAGMMVGIAFALFRQAGSAAYRIPPELQGARRERRRDRRSLTGLRRDLAAAVRAG